MKNKIVEFAQLDPTIYELALETFDNSEQRASFLYLVALSKLASLLDYVGVPKKEAVEFLSMLKAVSETIGTFSKVVDINYKNLSKLIKDIKNETRNARS